MGRPKGYDRDEAVLAARDVFWERGYEATSIGELEACTGLNRSSIYQAFGSKRGLFDAALECYVDREITAMLAGMEQDDAGLDAVVGFFAHLCELFRGDAGGSTRGCLMVNSTAELAAHDPMVARAAADNRDRVRAAFAHALGGAAARGQIDPELVRSRCYLLAATTMGVFLTVRIDPADAADLCDQIAGEVTSWATTRSGRQL
jgi:TetR/AcrR family transcriptional repressor of nem operon